MGHPEGHQIAEQDKAHRRGLVLGLTMAEVGILIIFVLLLLIGLEAKKSDAMRGGKIVPVERLRGLETADSLLTQLKESLHASNGATTEEIRRLIQALREIVDTPKGRTTLAEAQAALEQMRRIREQIAEDGGSEALAKQVEKLTYRIANQEGQLQLYETQLRKAGLGKGERPCWVRPDGTIEYFYDVVLTSEGIRMREYHYPQRERERSLLPMPEVDPDEILSPAEFLRRTQPLYERSQADNCRYFVVVYDATGPSEKELYKQLLRAVEGHFYKRLDSGRAPF